MDIEPTMRVRNEGALRVIVRMAKFWRAWVVAALAVIFLLGMLEHYIFHTSRTLLCVGVLFLICMFVSTATLLAAGYLIPPPKPLTKHHSLVNRLHQHFRTVLSALMLGVAAFWGAVVSIDVDDAMKTSGIEGAMEVGKTSVLYPTVTIAVIGLWVISMGVFVDVHRTDPEMVVSKFEEIIEKCFNLERWRFYKQHEGRKAVRAFLNLSTRGMWAFFVVYCFPLLVLLAITFAWGWIENYFASTIR
jgi:membrane protein